jgi:hypothetical protein
MAKGKKGEDPNDYSERNSTPRHPELTVLNLDVNPLKTKNDFHQGAIIP